MVGFLPLLPPSLTLGLWGRVTPPAVLQDEHGEAWKSHLFALASVGTPFRPKERQLVGTLLLIAKAGLLQPEHTHIKKRKQRETVELGCSLC